MPLNLTTTDRKLIMSAAGVVVLVVLLGLIFTKGGESRAELPTTFSTGSGGAKAAYLLLQASGYQSDRWERPLTDLPSATGTTLIIAEPAELPTAVERTKLHQFLEDGGTLIITGMYSGTFLQQAGAIPDPVEGMIWKQVPAISPTAITRAAPQITLARQAYWNSSSFALFLYGDGDKPAVVEYGMGKGKVFWWASATPLTNAGLKEPGNLDFFLACLGEAGGTRVLWDEYVHGYRQTLTGTISHSPVGWMFLQFGVLAFAVLITYSRRSWPVCVPASETRLSPLEFVRTLGLLYEKAHASSVAVDITYQRFRYWLARRLGISNNSSVEELSRAVRERWGFEDLNFAVTLHDCEAARYDNTLKPHAALKLVQALYYYSVQWKLFRTLYKEKDEWRQSRS